MTITPEERDQLIMTWQAAKAAADKAVAVERELRAKIKAELFPDAKPEGTTNLELGMGYKLKLVTKRNYNLASNDKVDEALEAIGKLGNEGTFIAERLVTWHPRLALSEYREAPDNVKAIIDGVLTVTDGTPTVELIEPKAK